MNSNLLISVVIPVYNASAHLREALDSILHQTFSKFELIVVDDGSIDDSVEVVKSYHDPRIRLIENAHDYMSSLNQGIDAATGKYIARMDADDVMLPHRLEYQLQFMENHPRIDICGSWAESFGTRHGMMQNATEHRQIIASLLLGNSMFHPTVMMRRSIFDSPATLRYPCGYPCAEDYKLWTVLAEKGFRFANIPEVLLRYRRSSSQVTERHLDVMKTSTFRIQQEYAKAVMAKISEKEERYFDFFNQLVNLSNDGLISFTSLLQITRRIFVDTLQ